MIHFRITGKIIRFFTPVKYDSAEYGQPDFIKQKILIEFKKQQYTLTFVDKKIELLENCNLGSVVEFDVCLKGRTWQFKHKDYSVNDLVCNSLKIIKNTVFNSLIYFNDKIYNVQKKWENEQLILYLINIEDKSKQKLTVEHIFPDKSKNKELVLINDIVDKELLRHLEKIGVLSIGTRKKGVDGVSGTICRILILELFEDRELLFSKTAEKEAIQRKYSTDSIIPITIDFKQNYGSNIDDYERDYFNTMTDGQMGNYDDFIDNGGDIDDINMWSNG